jgi:hypothetical protein
VNQSVRVNEEFPGLWLVSIEGPVSAAEMAAAMAAPPWDAVLTKTELDEAGGWHATFEIHMVIPID